MTGKHPLVDAVVFDLWQTLIYSPCPPWQDKDLVAAFGHGWKPMVDYMMDTAQRKPYASIDEYVADVVSKGGCDPAGGLGQRFRRATEAEIAATTTYPDALPALKDLKARGYKLGLLSNLPSPHREPINRLGLRPYFDALVLSCEEGLVKPETEIFQRACQRLAVPADRSLMVGDSVILDMQGARKAGLWAIWLNRPEEKLYARAIVEPAPPKDVPSITSLDALRAL
jgi:HAD superfamily hydrolase (TIGR01549 family)